MQIFPGILFALSIGGCASLNIKRTVATVENDIAQTAARLTALHDSLTAIPSTGGTLFRALTVHSASVTVTSNFTQTATDISALPTGLSESDGSIVSQEVLAMGPPLIDILTSFTTKRPSFFALPIGEIPALVLQDLLNLRMAVDLFLTALIGALPPDLRGPIEDLKERIDGGFTVTIQA
ncbi:hypothetical protein BD779DRAFT_1473244 [Infundibulicybe gibba]|nr:hypothetical protein BD779DRAFT_1473244 [Infundibulicybe gibba]